MFGFGLFVLLVLVLSLFGDLFFSGFVCLGFFVLGFGFGFGFFSLSDNT